MEAYPHSSRLAYSKRDEISLSEFPTLALPDLPLTGTRIVPTLGRAVCFELPIGQYHLRVDLVSAYKNGRIELENRSESPCLIINLHDKIIYQSELCDSILLERYAYCLQENNKTVSSLLIERGGKYTLMTLSFPREFISQAEQWEKEGQKSRTITQVFGKIELASHAMITEIHKLMSCSYPLDLKKSYLEIVATALLIDGIDKLVNHQNEINGHSSI